MLEEQADKPQLTVEGQEAVSDVTTGSVQQGETMDEKQEVKEEKKKKEPVFEKPKVLLSWDAPAREFVPRTPSFFIVLFIITAALTLVLVLISEYVLALVVAGVGFVIFAMNRFEPFLSRYELLNTGIRVQGREYRWLHLWSFCVAEREPFSVLYIKTNIAYPEELVILFPKEQKEVIEAELLNHLEYEEFKPRDAVGYLSEVVEEFPFDPDAPVPRAVRSLFKRTPKQSK
ncbi:hypothetical protein KJ596_02405 [Patescibacteria group bacterium]|nr:hypothetical protein [Patescibacteria group bacterium]MBU1868643.1 hypothetical protein [Patescibacteria group bacterium]